MGIKIHRMHPLERAEVIRELASDWVNRSSGVDHISDVYGWLIEQADQVEADYRSKEYKPTPEEKAKHKAAELRALEIGFPA